MPAAANLPFGLIIEAIAGLAIAGLSASAAAQLFSNAKTANEHVAAAIALGVPSKIPSARPGGSLAVAAAAEPAPADIDTAGQIVAQLNAYYAANISQGNTIFWASLLSMCIGFAIIFFGVVMAQTNGVTAIVAAIAGVLSQFIAATFLVALRSTQQQATTYAQTLVELRLRDVARAANARAVELGLRLLGEISADRSNPANPTKATIAAALIVKGPATIFEPPVVTVGPAPSSEPVHERRARSGGVSFGDTGAPERR